MSKNKFIFEYIKGCFNQATDYLANNNLLFLYGEQRIGKTYLAQLCMEKVSDTEYYKLYLKAYDGYNPSFYSFLLGLEKSDAIYELGKEIVSDIINNSNIQSLKRISKIIEYGSSYKQKCFSYLNDSEISIINRINIHCKNRPLFLVVDDYEKLDESSKKLILFFLKTETKKTIPFLCNCKIIIIGNNENCIDEIKRQTDDIKLINIKGYTSKTLFVEDFSKLNLGSSKLAEILYQITNGNMGMAYDLGLYMEEKSFIESTPSQLGEIKAKKLFLSIIDKRVSRINELTPKFANTIKAASVQGIVFNQRYLPEIVGENEFTIERILSIAYKEHLLESIKKK